jgi:translation initiation factor 5B
VLLSLSLRQPVVVVLGHVDSGKCIAGDTLVQLSNGVIAEASALFETYRVGEPFRRPDGVFYKAKGLSVLSVNLDGSVSARYVSHVWKLSSDCIVRVKTRTGLDIEVTPEHKFLVLSRDGEKKYVSAENLKLGDFLLVPSKTYSTENSIGYVKSRIVSSLSGDFLVRVGAELNEKIAAQMHGNRIPELGLCGQNNSRIDYCKEDYRADTARSLARIVGVSFSELYDHIENVKYCPKKQTSSQQLGEWLKLPKTERELEDLYYIAGVLHANVVDKSANRANTSNHLNDEYARCLYSAFAIRPHIHRNETCYTPSCLGGKTLSSLFAKVFNYPNHRKAGGIRIPEIVLVAPCKFAASFLRGLFDAKGCVGGRGYVSFACESPTFIKQLLLLLQRFGCIPSLYEKERLEVLIYGRNNLTVFRDKIGFTDPEKLSRLKEIIAPPSTKGMSPSIPHLSVKSSLGRNSIEGILIGPYPENHLSYESPVSSSPLRVSPLFGAYGNENLRRGVFEYRMLEVVSLTTLEGEFTVYDFTVPETHNFIANGLIVHNTSLLDKIRGTAVQAREYGGITQHIGASFFPIETVREVGGKILSASGRNIEIPGLLVIDTPGHEVFANLRWRGGSAADIAILVVDVQKGFEAQTFESVDILKRKKVPFVVALNKIDSLSGWKRQETHFVTDSLKKQSPEVVRILDEKTYNVVGALSRMGIDSESFSRVRNFARQVAIVPISARTGEGMGELMAVLVGLTQQYLQKRLTVTSGPPRGIVLEVKEETGLGGVANIVLLDGVLSVGDEIVMAKKEGAFVTRIKALFMPKPLDEMRDPRDKFRSVPTVKAAAGVMLVSPDVEGTLAGSPLIGTNNSSLDINRIKEMVESEIRGVFISTDSNGIVIKADTLGSLEALTQIVKGKGFPVRMADVGPVTRRDVVEADVVKSKDRYLGVVLGFNTKVLQDANEEASLRNVPVFLGKVIYSLVDSFEEWIRSQRENELKAGLLTIILPCEFKILKGYVFRRSNPAIVGAEIIAGRLKQRAAIMNEEGKVIGTVHQIQDKGKPIPEARAGSQVAVSLAEPTVGRQINEGETLYSLPNESEVKILREKYSNSLSEEEKKLLDHIVEIRRKQSPLFGF